MHRYSRLRFVFLPAVMFILAATVIAGTSPAYTMTIHKDCICIREDASGRWVYTSPVRASTLSPQNQLLLEAGIPLYDRAEFTSAIEDFCS